MATFRKGKGIRRTDLRKSGARCVRYGELYTRYRNYVVDPISRIPEDVAATALQIEKGDLLFAGSGETAEEIGTCVAYIGDQPAYAGGDIIVLRAPRQDPVCLAHLMNAPEAVRQKARMAQGDAVVHIRGDHLAEVELPLPPLPEQRAIAAVLMDVDALIGSLEALVAKKRAVKQAAMQQLLTGRTRLPGFDEEWHSGRLKDVAQLHRDHVMPPDGNHASYEVFSLPAYDAGRRPSVEPSAAIQSGKFRVPRDAVLLSRLNPRIPRVWAPTSIVRNAIASTEFLVLTPREAAVRAFLFWLCSSPQFCDRMVAAVTGTTGSHQRVNRIDAMNLSIRFPSLPEQRAIATVLSDMDAEITALERRLAKTRAVKQGMMQQLLTGSIRLPIPDAVAENGSD